MARGRPPKCIYCGSHRSIGKGVRRTKTMGARKLRVCKDCGRKFTPRHQGVQTSRPGGQQGDDLPDNGPHTDH